MPLSLSQYSTGGIDAWIVAIHIIGLSSMLGAVNFIATIHNMRAPGMGWGRLPLFVWTILIYSYLIVLASPALAAALADAADRPQLRRHVLRSDTGRLAAPVAARVLVLLAPGRLHHGAAAFGIVSEVLPVFARKPIFGYKAIAASTAGIAFLGMLVWAHHMFAVPMSTVVLAFFMLSSFVIAVPTGVKIFNWIATLWRGTSSDRCRCCSASAWIFTFLIGGITGIFLAVFPVDWQLTDTYFVVAHLHYVLFGGSVFGMLAGADYWFPKISRPDDERELGKASFWTMLIGFHITFLIQHSVGLCGMPRRIYEYPSGRGLGLAEPRLHRRLVHPRRSASC